MKSIIFIITLLFFYYPSEAQNVINSDFYINSGTTVSCIATNTYIGPDANLVVNGTLSMWTNELWISPELSCIISGTGDLNIMNPNEFGLSETTTLLDGNNKSNYLSIAKLSIQNPNGITLSDISAPISTWNTTYNNSTLNLNKILSLDVDGGNIYLGTSAIGDLKFSSSGTIQGYSSTRKIVTNNKILSHIVKDQSSSGTFTYPIGIANGDYNPAIINGEGTYNVSLIDYTQDIGLPVINVPDEGINRTWHIFGNESASSIQLTHNSTYNGSRYVENKSFIVQYANGMTGYWTYPGLVDYVSSGVNISTHWGVLMASTSTMNSSFYSKSSDATSPLPVRLLNFSGTLNTNNISLNWSTASEINNKGFYVERSSNGTDFHYLSFINTKAVNGNSDKFINYEYTDNYILGNTLYYRLKQVDFDGNIDYSNIISLLNPNHPSSVRVFPNPASSTINVYNTHPGYKIQIIDMAGKILKIENSNEYSQKIDVSKLASGIYYLRILDESGKSYSTNKFIKK
ncbi:T9SS type A sorting domain-containing protein [Rhizosphaericola mali]|uniref:T9SS type A sorting domain-containing protein n=1 Tax=Rhizosphaericola mali TaxID=2545455 RepID=A0A5P2G7L3_9BACT|nr:T9SS type A sorting domain-containing protein [Rhizosphaericola mali]QES90269.1 T9SS type A sorting domain-containing protein [Rhizosphaericola mali]